MAAHASRAGIDLDAQLGELYALEARVVAATPAVLDTGSPEEFLSFLRARGPVTVEGWRDGKGRLLAYLALGGRGPTLELISVAVDPSWQRQGLGRTLVRRAIELARLRGAARLELATSPANAPALALYSSEGFAAARLSANHYGDGTDRVILAIDPCLLYTSPSPRDGLLSRMPSSA